MAQPVFDRAYFEKLIGKNVMIDKGDLHDYTGIVAAVKDDEVVLEPCTVHIPGFYHETRSAIVKYRGIKDCKIIQAD